MTIDESVGPAAYNFRTKAEFEAMGSDFTALGRPQDWEEPKGRSESARAAVPDFAS